MRFVVLLLAMLVGTADARDPRDPVRLRLGTLAIDGSRYMKDILALGKEIEKRTRGTVILDWASGGQLGDDPTMASLVAHGKLDGGGFSETGLVALVPEMAAWGAPGRFHAYEDVERATVALDGTVRELFAKRDVVFAMWADLGFARVFSTDPIESLAGVLRAAAPQLAMPLDGKLSEAIASGRAHAWSVPPLYMLAMGTAKARHMTNLRHRYVVGGLVFSGAAWARLTAEEQRVVLEVCRDWEPRIRASWRKETERGIAALAKAGIATYAATAAEVATFLDEAAKAAPGELGAKIVAAIR